MDKNELKRVKFVQMRSQGLSFNKISEEIEISKPTLIKWSRELTFEIQNEIEFKKEEIRREMRLDYRRSLEIKSLILEKLEAEIEQSNFSTLSKIKLVELALQLSEKACVGLNLKTRGIPEAGEVIEWAPG